MILKRLLLIACVLGVTAAAGLAQADGAACCPVETVTACAEQGSSAASMGLLFFVFVLAVFLGAELIAKVPSQLHTPLMSGSNAISGISIVGALLALAAKNTNETAMVVLGTLAVALAMINVVGGYLVTDRMLGMFQAKKGGK
jgi:NAD(P) transhydrogenase subunit alpha